MSACACARTCICVCTCACLRCGVLAERTCVVYARMCEHVLACDLMCVCVCARACARVYFCVHAHWSAWTYQGLLVYIRGMLWPNEWTPDLSDEPRGRSGWEGLGLRRETAQQRPHLPYNASTCATAFVGQCTRNPCTPLGMLFSVLCTRKLIRMLTTAGQGLIIHKSTQ